MAPTAPHSLHRTAHTFIISVIISISCNTYRCTRTSARRTKPSICVVDSLVFACNANAKPVSGEREGERRKTYRANKLIHLFQTAGDILLFFRKHMDGAVAHTHTVPHAHAHRDNREHCALHSRLLLRQLPSHATDHHVNLFANVSRSGDTSLHTWNDVH